MADPFANAAGDAAATGGNVAFDTTATSSGSATASSGGKTPAPAGFDFSRHMRRLCADIIARITDLEHIDLDRVAISFSQSRKRVSHGLQASLTPLRFRDGLRSEVRRGRRWQVQSVTDAEGRELLYVLSFYLPRFLDLPFDEKFTTVLHELWHISPNFDGDLRRHPGRYYIHGSDEAAYDARARRLASAYLNESPPPEVYAFLKHDFAQLLRCYGPVFGEQLTSPKIIPCES